MATGPTPARLAAAGISLPYAGANRIRFHGCLSAAEKPAAAPRANFKRIAVP
jgi:hypothetical protein